MGIPAGGAGGMGAIPPEMMAAMEGMDMEPEYGDDEEMDDSSMDPGLAALQ